MMQFICGKKGAGKTKRMVDMANAMATETTGNVVFVDDNNDRMFDLKHAVRLVATEDFNITGADCLVGFLAGIVAADFDTSAVFVDSFLMISGRKPEELEDAFAHLEKICEKNNVKMVISMSGDPETMPEYVKQRTII